MKAPDWWWHPRPTIAALALAPLGALYGTLTARRMGRAGGRAGVPVICVGNLVVGGAGKTPTAIALAKMLLAAGENPAFLSRGYGGTVARRGGVVQVECGRHDAATVGDEPLLLAAVAPTFVGADRAAAARAAVAAGASILVMDDGLQSPALAKDLCFAVADGVTGIGNGLCLPAGPLRAPVADQWPFVSLLCVIGEGTAGDDLARLAEAAGRPVARGSLRPDPAAVEALRGRRLWAFAGIGRPAKFVATLRDAGLDVAGSHAFPDHHPYTAADLADLRQAASAVRALLVTTEKDRMRLPPDASVEVLPVALVFAETFPIVNTLRAISPALRR